MKNKILTLVAVLAIFAAIAQPAAAQFANTNATAGTACTYAPTLGIDASGNLVGCNGSTRVWQGSANATQTFTNKTFDTAGTGNSFLINGLAVTANTGTGAVVRAIAPTFSTTITLGVTTTAVGQAIFNNLTSGTVTLQPVTGALGSAVLSLPAATDTLVGKATTDTFSGKSFNQNVLPLNAGAVDLGQASLPFLHLWIGTAATNNFEFIPAATAAARTVTMNDTGANSTLRLEISGTATVDLASVASGACSSDSSDVTVTGAAVGDDVSVTAATALQAGGFLIGRVNASGTARFQFCNLSGGAIDRASDTYTVRVKR